MGDDPGWSLARTQGGYMYILQVEKLAKTLGVRSKPIHFSK